MTISTSQLKTTWRGAYNNGTTYNTNDLVLYSGSAWIYRNATSASGNTPGSASVDSTAYWYRITKGSDLGALTLGTGSLVKYDGSNFVAQAIGTAGQILKVNSGASDLEFGTGGGDIGYSLHTDRNRRTGSGENVTWVTNRTIYTKVSATSELWMHIELRGDQNQGNDCSVPQCTFTDSAGDQWRMAANYKGNGGHQNAHNNYRLYAHIGSANSFHRISGSADVAAAGAINFTLYTTSATGSGNDNWRVMNPTNSDDSRAYPHSNTKSFASVWQIFEIEPS